MPPNFKTAKAAGHTRSPNAASSSTGGQGVAQDEAPARAAAYVEKLFPDKFHHHEDEEADRDDSSSFVASTNFSRKATGATADSSNNSSTNPRLTKSLLKSLQHGAGGPQKQQLRPSKAALERKKRRQSNAARHLSWDREVVKKIAPIEAIKPAEKAGYWFSDSSTVVSSCEVCSIPVGRIVVIQPTHATVVHLAAWEKETTGRQVGRVTLYIAHVTRGIMPGPKEFIAVGSLCPQENSVKLNVQLPPGPYVLELRTAGGGGAKNSASTGGGDAEHHVLCLLQTRSEEHALV